MNKYNLDSLINKFRNHSEEFEKMSPNNDFNLPEALLLLCELIKKLEDKVDKE